MRELSYVLRFERDPDATAPAAVASGLVTNMNPGAVVWTIDSGTGFFAGATGLITSNLRVYQQNGQLIDDQVATILIPDEGTS